MSHKRINSRKTISVKLKTRNGIRLSRRRSRKRHRDHATPAIYDDLFNITKRSSSIQVVLEVFCFSISVLFLVE